MSPEWTELVKELLKELEADARVFDREFGDGESAPETYLPAVYHKVKRMLGEAK